MRKLLATLLAVSVGFVGGVVWLGSSLRAGAGGVASASGDVNGDGQIDVSDAVYTLLYLFKGGQPPVACADSAELVARVEALESVIQSSRTICWERPDRFLENGDGTVTDTCSGLQWLQQTVDVNADGVYDVSDLVDWATAGQVLDRLEIGGKGDWRLPTVRELEGITDGTRSSPPLAPAFRLQAEIVERFPNGGASWYPGYWTATQPGCCDNYAYTVSMADVGGTGTAQTIDKRMVIGVRHL